MQRNVESPWICICLFIQIVGRYAGSILKTEFFNNVSFSSLIEVIRKNVNKVFLISENWMNQYPDFIII